MCVNNGLDFDFIAKILRSAYGNSKGGQTVKIELEDLIKGKDIVKPINEDIVMKDVNKDSENVWSFLLFSGYLKVVHEEFKRGKTYCHLRIPNLEVKYLYEEIVMSWFSESVNTEKFDYMLKSLVKGDIKTFGKILKEFVLSSVSYFDTGGHESEKVYHAFVLGMLIALWDNYEVKSNRESGYGRYDVALIPKDQNKIGIIIEFKKVDHDDQETLEIAAKNALKQIRDKEYKKELEDRGIKEIIELGIAFEGKNVLVMK
ncbi:PD-(D/E)XK nuclease domain-containing protein [Crassaminicella profunda]|uniref:PD-(D/E)XK nuclease domain-containing protein n=1 Tax=Crassaminicella profunda TaxID=1286698 RepID=UPI001CA729F0|nr:PD-(D/E)XK nuclease domain-containing protein [Crassaminicella profunda]QZY54090.1 PD-(D/E)XK nuclease domain-containing protein [Crassaminicella profunda]